MKYGESMKYKNIMVTGGAGFIGGTFVEQLLNSECGVRLWVLDKLTYAAQPERLKPFESHLNFEFIYGDICDVDLVSDLLIENNIDLVVNFAAESHVDNSLLDASPFRRTNVEGVRVLLEACCSSNVKLFVQISTDEVYGQRLDGSLFEETSEYNPRNPYALSKVDAEKLVLEYASSKGLQYLITRGCNSFGPWQHAEKLIPKVISNALEGVNIPVYGDGKQQREWIAASDHAQAVYHLISKGYKNSVFNIGTGHTLKNIDVVHEVLHKLGARKSLIEFVEDRANHDFMYGINTNKLEATGWSPSEEFEDCMNETIEHYKGLVTK